MATNVIPTRSWKHPSTDVTPVVLALQLHSDTAGKSCGRVRGWFVARVQVRILGTLKIDGKLRGSNKTSRVMRVKVSSSYSMKVVVETQRCTASHYIIHKSILCLTKYNESILSSTLTSLYNNVCSEKNAGFLFQMFRIVVCVFFI